MSKKSQQYKLTEELTSMVHLHGASHHVHECNPIIIPLLRLALVELKDTVLPGSALGLRGILAWIRWDAENRAEKFPRLRGR